MRAAGGGALLRSASLDVYLQRHRYRIKDWRYSPAAPTVCDFHFVEMAAAACFDFVAIEGGGNGMIVEKEGFALRCRCRLVMRCAGGRSYSSAVDIFDGSSGRWSTAALSVARFYLAATSLPNQGLAIFAGGQGL